MIRVHIQRVRDDEEVLLNPKYIQMVQGRDGGHGSNVRLHEGDVLVVREGVDQLYRDMIQQESVIRVRIQRRESDEKVLLNSKYIQKIQKREGDHGCTVWLYGDDVLHVRETANVLFQEINRLGKEIQPDVELKERNAGKNL